MSAPRARRRTAWLALASFVAPSVLPLAAAGWLIAHHADDHAHALLVEADAGHFDLVLAHDDVAEHGHEHDDAPAHGHGQAEPRHPADHVVHLGSEQGTWQTSRRLAPEHTPLAAHAFAPSTPLAAPVPAFSALPSRSLDTLLLRTIVLRL